MKEITDKALQVAVDQGAEFVDVRIEHNEAERIVVKNGQIETISQKNSLGCGVRVISNGAWGFAATSILDDENIHRVSQEAVAIAKASSLINTESVRIAHNPCFVDTWSGLCKIDPRKVSLSEKIDYLLQCDRLMRAIKGISSAKCFMEFHWIKKYYANTDGSWIEQQLPVSGIGLEVIAIKNDEMQIRSYPNSMSGQFEGRGYEILERWPLHVNAEKMATEAVQLIDAKTCPEGPKTVIIDSTQLALQIHESCGHAVELDRVLGSEINDYGTSFLTPEKMGVYRYGSDIVNLTADPTLPGGLGSYAFDDEGVPAKRAEIVKNGIFMNYLTSRETALQIGQQESNASMRAENFNFIPLIRMTNLNLEPGTSSLEEMIGSTQDGILISTNKSFSIDDRRWQFQFGTEIGWLIKNGKLGEIVKNPVYSGTTQQFWQSCDAIAGQDEWILWGVPNCGKGQPDQGARVSHGCAPARFTNITVGGIRA